MDALIWIYRQVFYCKRRVDRCFCPRTTYEKPTVRISDIPWLWIGTTTADNLEFSVTNEINEVLEYEDIVDIPYLEAVTGIMDGISWRYLDSVELVEKEFPSEGILIEDASAKATAVTTDTKSD